MIAFANKKKKSSKLAYTPRKVIQSGENFETDKLKDNIDKEEKIFEDNSNVQNYIIQESDENEEILNNSQKNTTIPSRAKRTRGTHSKENNSKQRKKGTRFKDTVSLDEIKVALENKITKEQRKDIIKTALINVFIGICIIAYLILVWYATKNLEIYKFQRYIKIAMIAVLGIGIVTLELSYKKDNTRLAINGIEFLAIGGISLFLNYATKLNYTQIGKLIINIGEVVLAYYVIKLIILVTRQIHKFKRQNSDIREIVKKDSHVA